MVGSCAAFLAPVPSFQSFDALYAHLEERCLARMDSVLRGHDETIGQRMERDLEARCPCPPCPMMHPGQHFPAH